MASTVNNVASHAKANRHIYSDPRNMLTLLLWGIALASHAILLPRLIKELSADFKRKPS